MKPVPSGLLGRRQLLQRAGGLAALGLVAAACGSNTGREGASGGGLQQWYHQYGEAGTKQAVEKFAKAYPDADVSVQWVPGDYETKLSSGLLSSDAPDVFEYQLNISMVQSKQVEPLDDIIGPVKNDFETFDIETNTVDGKIYGVRMIDDPQVFYYRKSLLDKAGLKPPETLDELLNAAKELSNSKVKGIFMGNDGGVALGGPILHSLGLTHLSEDEKPTAAFDDPRFIAGLNKLQQLYSGGGVLKQAPTDWADPSAFTQELAAIQWCGLWAMPQIEKAFGDDFGVIPFPKVDNQSTPSVYAGGWTAFVSAKSKNKDKAKAFVKWLWIDQTKYQEEWNLDYGFHIPPRKSLSNKADKLKKGVAAEAVRLWREYAYTDDPRWTPKMATAFTDMITNTVQKGQDAKGEVDKAVASVDKETGRLFK